MNFFDWIFGSSAATAQGKQLDSQLAAVNAQRYANASPAVQAQVARDQASGSTDSAWANIFAQQDASTGAGMGLGSENNGFYALGGATGNGFGTSGSSTTLGQVLKDYLLLAVIGAAAWAFFKFGGAGWLKSFAKKGKWFFWGTVAAVVLVAWFIYSEFKKTATDTQSTASEALAGIKTLNPFGGN